MLPTVSSDGSSGLGGRVACVLFPLFPLQLLLRNLPEWRELPTAVVDEDKPLGTVLFVNRRAREAGVEVGTRYNTALTICPDLRVGAVSAAEVSRALEECRRLLYHYSPEIERCDFEDGVFWLGISGMDRLFGGPDQWRRGLEAEWPALSLLVRIRLGFSRLGTYLAAHVGSSPPLFSDRTAEAAFCREAPLSLLPFEPKVRLRLGELGLRRVGPFLDLAVGSVRRRFGSHAARLHSFLRSELDIPLQYEGVQEEPVVHRIFDTPLKRVEDMVHEVDVLLERLFSLRPQALEDARIVFHLDNGESRQERLLPARPGRDRDLFGRLLRLRLVRRSEQGLFVAGVVRIDLAASFVRTSREQLELFRRGRRRDPAAAAEALALVRGELGNEAVCRVRFASSHLPEEQFIWEPLPASWPQVSGPQASATPTPPGPRMPVLVRRLFSPPLYLSSQRLPRRNRRLLRRRLEGPGNDLSVYWWRGGVRRRYYYYRDESDRLLWVFFDYRERRWKVQGVVE